MRERDESTNRLKLKLRILQAWIINLADIVPRAVIMNRTDDIKTLPCDY